MHAWEKGALRRPCPAATLLPGLHGALGRPFPHGMPIAHGASKESTDRNWAASVARRDKAAELS